MPLPKAALKSRRLLSLDFMRGFVMVLLALKSTGLYENLLEAAKGSFSHQFFSKASVGWCLIGLAFFFLV